MATRLLLVRHGSTTSPPGTYAGSTDAPLSAGGRAQSEMLSERLHNLGEWFDKAYCSDKARAIETARIICSPRGISAIARPELREICHGRWEGMTRDEVVRSWPDEHARWEADPCMFAPEGGEPAIDVARRAIPLVGDVVESSPGQTVLIVSHRAVLRLVVAHYLGVPYRLYRDLLDLDHASLSILELKDRHRAKLLLFNDTSHYELVPGPGCYVGT